MTRRSPDGRAAGPRARRLVGLRRRRAHARQDRAAAATAVGEPRSIDLDLDDGSQHPAMAMLKDAFARGRRVHLRYYVATATSRPSATSTSCASSTSTGSGTSRATATAPRTSGSSGSTASRTSPCSMSTAPRRGGASRDLDDVFVARRERPHGRHRGESLGGLDRRLLPQRGSRAWARRFAAGDPQGRRPGSSGASCCASGERRGSSSRRSSSTRWPTRHGPRWRRYRRARLRRRSRTAHRSGSPGARMLVTCSTEAAP